MCTGLATDTVCPASAANAIAAAFHTQGYYVMADIVYQLQATNFGLWVPFIYIAAVFGAGIMMAMGQPPKIYVWFLIGPFIFNWALFTTVPVKGVAWNIGGQQQDQNYVWKLAEVGLLNTNIQGGDLTGSDSPQQWGGNDRVGSEGEIRVSANREPSANVHVPLLFLNFDSLISGQIQALTAWTGVSNQKDNNVNNSNIPQPAEGGGGGRLRDDDAWHMLSNSKWPLFENIKAVKLHDQNMRGAFMQFMASECGEALKKKINKANYINASQNRGTDLPKTLFGGTSINADGVKKALSGINVPVPSGLVKLLTDPNSFGIFGTVNGSFPKFLKDAADRTEPKLLEDAHVNCAQYLTIIVQGFRWESGHQYNQLIAKANELGMTEGSVVRSLLYGWSFKKGDGTNAQYNNRLSPEDQKKFVQNYILVNLIRNEAAFAHNVPNERWSPSDRAVNYVKSYQETMGSKNKFGEFYSWAKLMPYVQGVLLYILTIAYPFACIMMVIPGMWKSMFTWMAFMAWAKSWDLGFAVVMTLERSVWAMLGNSREAAGINGRILEMKDFGQIDIRCRDTAGFLGCAQPIVEPNGEQTFENALKTLDQGLLLSSTMGMDYSGSAYYIYIMSALYFAVPAVTGQLLLGAKAGASSIASGMFTQAAGTLGQAAQTGAQSDAVTGIKHAMANTQQAIMGKSARQGAAAEFMAKSLGDGNRSLDYSAASGFNQRLAGLNDLHRNMAEVKYQRDSRASTAGGKFLDASLNQRKVNAAVVDSVSDVQPAVTAAQTGINNSGNSAPGAGGRLGQSSVVKDRAGWPGAFGALADYNAFYNYGQKAGALLQANANLQTQGFELGARQAGFQTMSSRWNDAAQHAGQQQLFNEMQEYASNIAGVAGVYGAFAGSIEAGAAPMSLPGLSSAGQGGSSLKSAYYYPSAGYENKVTDAHKTLQGSTDLGRYHGFLGYSGGIVQAGMWNMPVAGQAAAISSPTQDKLLNNTNQPGLYQDLTGANSGQESPPEKK